MQIPQSFQLNERKRFSRKIWIIILCSSASVIIILLIASITGHFPTVFGVTPIIFASIISAIVGVTSLVIGVIPIIPTYMSSNHQVPSYLSIPSLLMNKPPWPTSSSAIEQRESAVKEIYSKLVQPDISSVVLTGIGGQGKTTLAALVFKYAEKQHLKKGLFRNKKELFLNPLFWLNVEQKTEVDDIIRNILYALNVPIPDFETLSRSNRVDVLLSALDTLGKPCLIVIDHFESLVDPQTGKARLDRPGVGEFISILDSRPCASRILVTSRLLPQGISGLSFACLKEHTVDGLSDTEGVGLLRKRGVTIQRADEVELQAAVRHCNGHAFALTLLASYLYVNHSLTIKAILSNSNYNQKWGADLAVELLDGIYEQLNVIQRDLLLSFSVYQVSVTIEAAIATMDVQYENVQIGYALDALIAQHLLQTPGELTYQLHAIVADYALTHFDINNKSANEAAKRSRHAKAAQYYLQQAQLYCPQLSERHGLDDVQFVIEAIRHYCQAEQWELAYNLINEYQIFPSFVLWEENTILLELYQLLLKKDWQSMPQQATYIYDQIGSTYDALDQRKEALKYYEQALNFNRSSEDYAYERLSEAQAYKHLSEVEKQKWLSDVQKHEKLSEAQARELLSEAQARELLSEAQRCKGTILSHLGKWYGVDRDKLKAKSFLEQSLQIMREIKYRKGEGNVLHNLGWVYGILGLEVNLSLEYYKQALDIRQSIEDSEGRGMTLWDIGKIYSEQSRNDVALACLLLARKHFSSIQSPNSDRVQEFIDTLSANIGDQQFTQLLAQVEPHAQQIVDEALNHEQNH